MQEFALSQGKLSERPLAALLWAAYYQNASGELRISTSCGENRIVFYRGAPASVKVSVGFRSLAEILVEHCLVDLDAIDCTLPLLEAGKTLPEVLLEQGAIQPSGLCLGRKLQHEAHLRSLAELKEGNWEFTHQSVSKLQNLEHSSLIPHKILIEAMSASSAEPWIARILNDQENLAVEFVDLPKLYRWLRFFNPGDHERKAVASLSENWHWSELISLGVNINWARWFTATMLLLEVAKPLQNAVPAEIVVEKIEPASSIRKTAPTAEGENVANPADFKRRQRLLRRAFRTLGAFPSPALEHLEGTGEEVSSQTADTSSDVTSSATPATSTPVTEEDRAFAQKVDLHYQTIGSDYFARLQLPFTATREQIRQTYLQLVKCFHPDQVSQTQATLLPKVKDIFAAIQEAYETLHEDTKRKKYIDQLAASRAIPLSTETSSSKPDHAQLAKQGEIYLKKKDYASAATAFASAFQLSSKAIYLTQEAWACYLEPEPKIDLPEIKRKLEQALKLESNCDRAAYSLGVIHRVEGDLVKAERYFRLAFHSNPRNSEAATELRLIEMRQKKRR